MLVKLLFLLLIILIAVFLIIFSESIHVSVLFNYIDNVADGRILIRYYFINFIHDFNNSITKLIISTRFLSKEFILSNDEDESDLLYEKNNKTNEENNNELSVDNSKNNNNKNISNLIKRYYPDVIALKKDIFDIVVSVKEIFFIDKNYLNINLGLKDNNLTIKLCTFLWSLAAIFYPIGLNMVIKPLINESKIEIQSNLKLDISLLSLLKFLFKVIFNIKLIKLLISIYKEMN